MWKYNQRGCSFPLEMRRNEVRTAWGVFLSNILYVWPQSKLCAQKSWNLLVICNKFPSCPSLNYRIMSSSPRIRRRTDSRSNPCHHGHSKAASGIQRTARNLYSVSSETRTRLGKQIHTIRRSTADTATEKWRSLGRKWRCFWGLIMLPGDRVGSCVCDCTYGP